MAVLAAEAAAAPAPAPAALFFGAPLPRAGGGVNAFDALSAALLAGAPAGSEARLAILWARAAALDDALVGKAWGAAPAAAPAPRRDAAPALAALAAAAAAADADGLARWAGLRHDEAPAADAAAKAAAAAAAKRWADERAALVGALWRRARALCAATLDAAAAGGAAAARLAPPPATRAAGVAASDAFASGAAAEEAAALLPPAPPPGADAAAFSAAVAALAPWSPVAGAEGPHAPLLACEAALRERRWASALEAATKAAAGAQEKGADAGLAGLHPLALAHIRVYCLLQLGLPYFAARVAATAAALHTKVTAVEP